MRFNSAFSAQREGNDSTAVGLLPTAVSVLLVQIGSNPSVLGSSDGDQGLYSVGQGMRKDEAEGLGESGNDFNEMDFSIEKVTVTGKSRVQKVLVLPGTGFKTSRRFMV